MKKTTTKNRKGYPLVVIWPRKNCVRFASNLHGREMVHKVMFHAVFGGIPPPPLRSSTSLYIMQTISTSFPALSALPSPTFWHGFTPRNFVERKTASLTPCDFLEEKQKGLPLVIWGKQQGLPLVIWGETTRLTPY